mmetsp:Transcript_9915/g.24110  ORF Transcript_9915/g.24110 Transcript_9915/m.24110 type:complete len:209 (-) Transcript_9915:638-1264(-)
MVVKGEEAALLCAEVGAEAGAGPLVEWLCGSVDERGLLLLGVVCRHAGRLDALPLCKGQVLQVRVSHQTHATLWERILSPFSEVCNDALVSVRPVEVVPPHHSPPGVPLAQIHRVKRHQRRHHHRSSPPRTAFTDSGFMQGVFSGRLKPFLTDRRSRWQRGCFCRLRRCVGCWCLLLCCRLHRCGRRLCGWGWSRGSGRRAAQFSLLS